MILCMSGQFEDTTMIDSVRIWNGLGSLEEYLNSFSLSRWE